MEVDLENDRRLLAQRRREEKLLTMRLEGDDSKRRKTYHEVKDHLMRDPTAKLGRPRGGTSSSTGAAARINCGHSLRVRHQKNRDQAFLGSISITITF